MTDVTLTLDQDTISKLVVDILMDDIATIRDNHKKYPPKEVDQIDDEDTISAMKEVIRYHLPWSEYQARSIDEL